MEQPSARVLVIEDEEQNVLLMEDFLAPLKLEIYKAYDGVSGMKLARIVKPDAILLDIHMPEMDGIEVCRRLKEEPAFHRVPILFVTALGDMQTQVQAVQAGGYAFITKPIRREQLQAYLGQALWVRKLEAESEQAVSQTRTAVGMLAHDVRNLIQINHGYIHLVLSTESLPKDVLDFVERMRQVTVEMMVMTNALLDLEKKEATGFQPDPELFSLSELIRQRVEFSSIAGQGRRVELALLEGELEVRSDRQILSRVLDNLFLNAVKFCPSGGIIRISLKEEPTCYRILTANDGEAIPAEWQERIFQPFENREVRNRFGRKGVGLGLAFCKMALDVLDGSIRLQSPLEDREDGVGFEITVPK